MTTIQEKLDSIKSLQDYVAGSIEEIKLTRTYVDYIYRVAVNGEDRAKKVRYNFVWETENSLEEQTVTSEEECSIDEFGINKIWDGDKVVDIVTDDQDKNRLAVDTVVNLSTTLATQIYGWHSPTSAWVKINAEEYPVGSGEHWIGVFGEVGTRTKADNPINICIRKSLATAGVVIFLDETVPANELWYLLKVGVADDIAAEFNLWTGSERGKVELFNGDGVNKSFSLVKGAIANASYVKVEIYTGGQWVDQPLNSEFWVDDHPTDYNRSNIRLKSAPAVGTENIKVTYDSVTQKQGWFVQASMSFQADIDAPLKLATGDYVIVGVRNKSSNTGIVLANISGFKENV